MNIPKDPYILLSYINTKLRDEFQTLASLCENLDIDQSWLESLLSSIDYGYAQGLNQFIAL